jgi:dinuclear metal center YbgI/SA1388 family protein
MTSSVDPPTADSLTIADVVRFLQSLAPLDLAESWDNVGLLWGDPTQRVTRVMTCLTLSQDVADEAANRRAELIVAHHPILFRPVQRLTADTIEGRMLLGLAKQGIAVYSAHTAYDNARDGINHQLAEQLGLQAISVLRPMFAATERDTLSAEPIGSGRFGTLAPPRSLAELIVDLKSRLGVEHVDFVGRRETRIERLAIACGSAAEFIDDALQNNCQALLTGEARFHACLEARERGLALILIGHFASERPAMRILAEQIGSRFPALDVWASIVETDPIGRA